MKPRALALLLACLPATVPAAELGFVYVEPNVGGASGGHFALRLGDRVYAHHASDDGLLVLERQSWERFRFHYATLENRPVHVAYVELSESDLATVRDGFASAWLRERRLDAELERLRDDAALLEAWLGRRPGWHAPGAGLLDPRAAGSGELRRRIASEFGTGHLAREIERVDHELRSRSLTAPDLTRTRERLVERAALVALRDAQALAREAGVVDDSAPLRPEETRSAAALRERLAREVLELLASRRPDKGQVLFLAIARHAALERSLETGRLFVLDPLVDGRLALSARQVGEHRAELEAIAGALDTSHRADRAAYLASGTRGLQRLEERVSLRAEYRRALDRGLGIRRFVERRAPRRRRALLPPAAYASPESLLERLAASAARERAVRERRHDAHRYDLLRNNCATGLVATLNAALGGALRTHAVLGARLEPGARLGFITAVLFADVRDRLRTSRIERIASHRETRLAGLPAGERWREPFTLTSRVYRTRHADTSFLLFTDDVRWRRPLYGLINLGYGVATGLVGIAALPLDGGRRLERGLLGALFSLPELAGFNLRKGSFDAATLHPPE